MKLAEILNYVNSFEKNSFLRVIDNIISDKPRNFKRVDKILRQLDGQLKNADNNSVTAVLELIEDEYVTQINEEFTNTTSQLDILIDIIIRDGNSLMKREWLLKLYEKEIRGIKAKLKQFRNLLDSEVEDPRIKLYQIYEACLNTAYSNDVKNNQDCKITKDEQSILVTLANRLEMSHEEVKLINYSVVPLKKNDVDEIIKYLSKIGVILYSRKNHQVYVPDEVVRILRRVRDKEVSDKVFRKILRQLKDSQINLLCRKHNIDRKLDRNSKVKEIIKEGINFTTAMLNGIHKEGTKKNEKRTFLNDLIEKKLKIETHIKGVSLEDKLTNLKNYLNEKDRDTSISISIHGYDKLMSDLKSSMPRVEKMLQEEFELEDTVELNASTLMNYNIKPIDVLYLLDQDRIKQFCEKHEISIRGNEVNNILSAYKDVQNLLLENYTLIASRDINALKENGVAVKDSDLGLQFEELTKLIFEKLGFDVDEDLKRQVGDSKNKSDIVIRLSDDEIVIIECKSIKERGYNKYSTVSRQVKAYKKLAENKNYRVLKTFIVAPGFTDDFIRECGLDYDLNLSLITAEALYNIYNEFMRSDLQGFPLTLLMRDVLINEDRIIKSITK